MDAPVLSTIALTVSATTVLAGPTYQVKQGNTVLATSTAFSAPGHTMAQFYNYGGGGDPKYRGRAGIFSIADLNAPGLGTTDMSIFLVNASDGLGLYIVTGDGTSDGNTPNGFADMTIDYSAGAWSAADLLVEDDNNESAVVGGDIDFDAQWLHRFTDGFVVKLFNGFTIGDEIRIKTNGGGATDNNITNVWSHGTGGSVNTGASYSTSSAANNEIILTLIPLPSAAALAGLGLVGVGLRRQRH